MGSSRATRDLPRGFCEKVGAMILRGFTLALGLTLLVPTAANAQFVGKPPSDGPNVSAQVYGPSDPRVANIYADTRETRRDVRHAVKTGEMSKKQARSFKRQSRHIEGLASLYSANGPMSASAARDLEMASRALNSMANSPAARAARTEKGGKGKD